MTLAQGIQSAAVLRGPPQLDLLIPIDDKMALRIGNFNDKIIITANPHPRTDMITQVNEFFSGAFKHIFDASRLRIDENSFRAEGEAGPVADRIHINLNCLYDITVSDASCRGVIGVNMEWPVVVTVLEYPVHPDFTGPGVRIAVTVVGELRVRCH